MIRPILECWNQFWFRAAPVAGLQYLRLAVACLTAIWFASFLPTLGFWFGESGLLSTATSSRMLEFAEVSRWQRWSPLWLTDSLLAYQVWVCLGIVLSLVVATGIWGRLSVALLCIWVIAWSHRVFWMASPVEPALVMLLGALIIQPGYKLAGLQSDKCSDHLQSANLTRRLIQVQFWMLLAAGMLTQLASLTWWRGEAVWWMVASGRSNLLSLTLFHDRPWLVNGLTHGIILLEAATLWFLVSPVSRRLGVIFGWSLCVALAVVSDQVLYGLCLACGLLAFWPAPKTE